MALAFMPPCRPSPRPLFSDTDYAEQRAFFAAHPDLRPTPLRRFDSLGRALGIAELLVKDETARFGLNAFKTVGATFAIAALREGGKLRPNDTLVCASEGNHGRAVAHAARDAGCCARVYVSATIARSRVTAIESEGATVIRVRGTYDDALREMVRDAQTNHWRVISDTALEGEPVDVPHLIMLGYTRVMDEAATQWQPGPPPDVIFVPGGVGGFLASVADWTIRFGGETPPAVVCVEPLSAACLQASARAGRPVTVAGPFDTVMAGLRCAEVSRAGFNTVFAGVNGYIAIEDRWAIDGMRRLAAGLDGDPVVLAGASGAAALGGVIASQVDPAVAELKGQLALGPSSRVVILVTEGVTDPELFDRVVRNPTNEHPTVENREP